MPDAATWTLTLSAPAVAAGVALLIDRRRSTDSRAAIRREELRTVFAEGADLLMAAGHASLREKKPSDRPFAGLDPAVALTVYRDKLRLWIDEGTEVFDKWTVALTAATISLSRLAHDKGEIRMIVPVDTVVYERWMARSSQEVQDELRDATADWLRAARVYLDNL